MLSKEMLLRCRRVKVADIVDIESVVDFSIPTGTGQCLHHSNLTKNTLTRKATSLFCVRLKCRLPVMYDSC